MFYVVCHPHCMYYSDLDIIMGSVFENLSLKKLYLFIYHVNSVFGSQVNSCNKEQLEKYSIPVVSAVAETVAAISVPLVYTLRNC